MDPPGRETIAASRLLCAQSRELCARARSVRVESGIWRDDGADRAERKPARLGLLQILADELTPEEMERVERAMPLLTNRA